MRRAVIYVTATYSEFFADPRIMAKDIEQLQAFVCGKGWQLCEETNLDFPGVFHDPADTDKFTPAECRMGCRAAIEASADVIVVQNLIRLAASIYKLADTLQCIRNAGKELAVQDDDRLIGDRELEAIRTVIPLHHQTHGGRVRIPKSVAKFPGRPAKAHGPCSPFELKVEIEGENVRVPNKQALREVSRAIELRASGLSWFDLADRLEAELAAAERRPALDEEPITIERYIRKCGRAQHTADWNFRRFIEEHSFNRPFGTISRRWGRVRLIRILHRNRHRLDRWLSDRGLSLADFS